MLISYIIPTYNRAHLVSRAIDSILRQPYPKVEVIVVDDASTDAIATVVEKYRLTPNISFIRQPNNRGQNAARNKGIAAARGEVVTILDSDDADYGANLAPIVAYFEKYTEIGGIFTPVVSMQSKKRLGDFRKAGEPFFSKGFVDGSYSGEHQVFLRKRVLIQPVFEENLGIKRSCTLLTWLRLGSMMPFTVLDYPTRLYDESGSDRMGSQNNIMNDARELIACTNLVLERHGKFIQSVSPRFYHKLMLKNVYYSLLDGGRIKALKEFSLINLRQAPLLICFFVLLSILLGSKITKFIRLRLLKR